jgi:hypothetical protein
MVYLQRVMEQVCFGFAQQALPELLKKRQWACAVAVELHLWKDELLKNPGSLPPTYEQPTGAMEQLLQTMAFIRHVAVFRINISVTQLQKCVKDAVDLTKALGQTRFLSALTVLREQIDSEILGLWKEEEFQRHLLDMEKSVIEKERAELDDREKRAIQSTEQKLAGCQDEVGAHIQDIVCSFRDILLVGPGTMIKAEVPREERRDMSGSSDSDEGLDFCSLQEQNR